VAAQGATTPLPALTPDALPLLPQLQATALQTVGGSGIGVAGGSGAGSVIEQGSPGGMLTGGGIGTVTLGPALPPRCVQLEPSHVQVWSYSPVAWDAVPKPPKITTWPVVASYAEAAPLASGGVVPGCARVQTPVQIQVCPSAVSSTSLCPAGSPMKATPGVGGPFLKVATFFHAVPVQMLSVPVQHAGGTIGTPFTQPVHGNGCGIGAMTVPPNAASLPLTASSTIAEPTRSNDDVFVLEAITFH
jgi:hypothetical protein